MEFLHTSRVDTLRHGLVDILGHDEAPEVKLQHVKRVCLTIGQPIELPYGVDIPSARASAMLLAAVHTELPSVNHVTQNVALSGLGCWELPLRAEYDTKGRARYPSVTNKASGAHNELVHRFMLRRMFGVTLERYDFVDHVCRSHACCNPTHLDIVTPRQNNIRKHLAARAVTGQERLF